MRILALDIATKTGWAHSMGPSGVWDFKLQPDESGGMRSIRLLSKLRETFSATGIDLIAFESASVSSGKKANFRSAKIQIEMIGSMKTFCHENEIEYVGYNISEIKSHALPNTKKRDKEAMVKAAREKWPNVEIVDDNQADALWVLDIAKERLNLNG